MRIDGPPSDAARRARRRASRRRGVGAVWVALLAMGMALAGPMLVAAQTAEDPSNVVLVFDVSNSILLSEDGTNTEFASALEGIADRVEASAEDLTAGNATISFVAFGRTAINYPSGCNELALRGNPGAVEQLADCLRDIAADYEAGVNAPVRQRINTQDTDHVAALRRAAQLLPDETTRSAVIFFTDGQHDPPGSSRDDEDVVAEIANAYEGRTPLAILPVGLGSGAGAFETNLRALFDAYFRDMQPCEGRAEFSWPEVVFESADDAGTAVASALQEVTCSFVFVPPPSVTPPPSPTPEPTPTPPPPGAPIGVQLLPGNQSITVQWLEPTEGAERITDYLVHCRPEAGGDWIESTEGVSTDNETVIEGLQPGVAYVCEVAASNGTNPGPYTPAAASAIVLGIPPAPGQPRAEPLDGAALVSVDPVAGGVPAEDYIFECTDAAGQTFPGAGIQPNATITGLVNGQTYTCVAYAENRIGRSPASVASAAFSPCSGIIACSPLLAAGIGLGVLLVGLVMAFFAMRMYQRRSRVWVTAQLDGGPNLPLGWGPDIGVSLEQAESGGMFASPSTFEGADIKAQYSGNGRFLVSSRAGIHDVHQGDPAPVRDIDGNLHQLILRRYRSRPDDTPPPPVRKEDAAPHVVAGRLEGREEEPPPTWEQPASGAGAAGAEGAEPTTRGE